MGIYITQFIWLEFLHNLANTIKRIVYVGAIFLWSAKFKSMDVSVGQSFTLYKIVLKLTFFIFLKLYISNIPKILKIVMI